MRVDQFGFCVQWADWSEVLLRRWPLSKVAKCNSKVVLFRCSLVLADDAYAYRYVSIQESCSLVLEGECPPEVVTCGEHLCSHGG